MQGIDRGESNFLYQQVVDLISGNIDSGTLRPGDRLPSLRQMSIKAGVSVPTVRQAYVELERQRKIRSRPQSGFYVRRTRENPLVRPSPAFRANAQPTACECRSLMDRVYEGLHDPSLVPLGIANPSLARPAAKSLHRAMKRVMSRAEQSSISYAPTRGEPALRRQIAWRYLDTIGTSVDPDEVCVTNGGQEALSIALQTVAGKGDVIAVESPTYHGTLELIDSLGMLAIEVETCPEDGVTLSALEKTLDTHPVRACIFSTTLHNPLGVSMPARYREQLAELIEARDIFLIEDDVYGELTFDGNRPKPIAAISRSDKIITVGSFSKTAAPGYRIGWILTGRFQSEVERLKRSLSCTSGLLQQLTLADFLGSGDYDRHLKMLRPVLRQNAERMRASVAEFFPEETRTSSPVGGSVLWLEMPGTVSSSALFDDAIEHGISVAPGTIYSPKNRYENFLRLSFGHPWTPRIEESLAWLGSRVSALAAAN